MCALSDVYHNIQYICDVLVFNVWLVVTFPLCDNESWMFTCHGPLLREDPTTVTVFG